MYFNFLFVSYGQVNGMYKFPTPLHFQPELLMPLHFLCMISIRHYQYKKLLKSVSILSHWLLLMAAENMIRSIHVIIIINNRFFAILSKYTYNYSMYVCIYIYIIIFPEVSPTAKIIT